MVLESLLNPLKAKEKPWEALVLGFVYVTISLFLSYWVFKEYSSLLMVFLTTLAATPLFFLAVKKEESLDLKLKTESQILKEHAKVIFYLMFLFAGAVFAMVLFYVLLPKEMIQNLFSVQTSTILSINNQFSGATYGFDVFLKILLNNVRVLVFCILFSFIYGMGAIFILTWNASVIAVAIGNFIRKGLSSYSGSVGLKSFSSYLHVFSMGFLRYALHGIPEILAYFVGALAGGIISVAVIKKDFKTEKILLDASELILLSIFILIVAAFLEVYVTPLFF